MNTTSLRPSGRRALPPCALLLLGPVLSGCGGGGGSTAATTPVPAARITLSGTLLGANSTALAGYGVIYAPVTAAARARRAEAVSGAISAVSDSQGRYSMGIPVSEATPGATLSVYTPAGVQVQSQAITLDPSQSVQTTITTVAPQPATSDPGAPPAPPTVPG